MAEQELNHTVFLVGWTILEGLDKKTNKTLTMPVWIARNSYGDKWGTNGDFYVRRG